MPKKNNLKAPPGRAFLPRKLNTKTFTTLPAIIIAVSSLWLFTGCEDTWRLWREAEEGAGLAGETSWLTENEWPIPRFLHNEGDRPDDIIGYVNKGDHSPWVSIALYDGVTFEQRWEAGPFKVARLYGRAHEPLLAATKGHIVASPDHRSIHIFNGRDGMEHTVLEMDSEVRAICPAPSDAGTVWIDLASTRHRQLDVTTGRLQPMQRPSWCPDLSHPSDWQRVSLRCGLDRGEAICRDRTLLGEVESPLYETGFSLELGNSIVSVGRMHPDDQFATTIIGHQRGQEETSWRQEFEIPVLVAHLESDTFYALLHQRYVHTAGRIVAIDRTSGVVRWNVELPWHTHAVTGPLLYHEGRLYLARSTWLDVFDATTGETLANIGTTP